MTRAVQPKRPSNRKLSALLVLAGLTLLAANLRAETLPEAAYQDLHWRQLGPFRAGWATAVAGVPGEPALFYFGGADGGVWRTADAGATWRPLFAGVGSGSIGALAVAPSDPRVIWVGTGQIHQRWDIVSGDGVHRSSDGGATWSPVGLADSRHIGDLWIDPRDARVAIVAALGHVFGPNPERGLFRTEDAGATWSRVLFRDADTGACDIAGDPALPDTLYASLWQLRRWPWLDYFDPPVGPGSGIHKSTDGGRTWTPAGATGLPPGPLGRIELAVAPGAGAARVWAAIDAETGRGLYRSDDGGASWRLVNDRAETASSYMSGLVPDPANPDIVWAMGRDLKRSSDGGSSFTVVRAAPGGDDYHDLWIDPANPLRMATGADQGAVVTLNGGESWSSWYNQPTGQFYRLAADERFPYWIYSGQQDTGTVAIASRSDYGQLTFRDWHPVGGDERDGNVPDPEDPDLVYGAGLGGRVTQWDARTGQVRTISPWPVGSYAARPGTTRYRYDWITPIAISKRPPHALYAGAQVLFRSLDRGASWATVSPDLTGAGDDDDAAGCAGSVPVPRATACGYGVIFAIAPSPARDGLVWVGTTNGRVQKSADSGVTWRDVTPGDLADWTKINSIDPSATDPATAYVAADRHRLDDFRPLAWKTHDGGASWTAIGAGLPEDAWIGVVRHDPERPGLLYAGTRRGVFVSSDDGASWRGLQLDLPVTGINDLLVHDGDLIAATQGRGLWVLDDLGPLRRFDAEALASPVALAPPSPAHRLRANLNRDTPLPPEEPRGENPPAGAVLDYRLAADAKGAVTLEILDGAGRSLRTLRSDERARRATEPVYFADLWRGEPARPGTRAGHHRFVWDLRLPPPEVIEAQFSIAALPGQPVPELPQGALVPPGRYQVRLRVDGGSVTRPLEVLRDPRAAASVEEIAELGAFQGEVAAALERAARIAGAVRASSAQLAADASDPSVKKLWREIEKARAELVAWRSALGAGDDPEASYQELLGLAIDLDAADASPTAPQRELAREAVQRLDRVEPAWRRLAAATLDRLADRLTRLRATGRGGF
jgi:photosystem II stability/assembly factor-like uncharacterized protein